MNKVKKIITLFIIGILAFVTISCESQKIISFKTEYSGKGYFGRYDFNLSDKTFVCYHGNDYSDWRTKGTFKGDPRKNGTITVRIEKLSGAEGEFHETPTEILKGEIKNKVLYIKVRESSSNTQEYILMD